MKKITLLLMLIAGLSVTGLAQLSIDAASTDYTIDFDATVFGVNNGTYAGTGFNPSPGTGQLDSDAWATTGMSTPGGAFGGTYTTDDFARGTSTGGEGTGGFWAFDIGSSDFIFGIQPGGSDWTPGTATLKLVNNTGSTITSLDIEYDIEEYNDQARANSLNFSHSSDDVSYTSVPALDHTTVEAAAPSPGWVNFNKSTTLTGLSIADGANYYLRWEGDDVSGGGSRDEYGFHNIVVNATTGVSNSADSDIVKASGWSEPVNIDYTLYSASSGLNTTNAIKVGEFKIRDGGATSPDSDSEATILTSITFTINNFDNIEALAIIDFLTNVSEVTTVTASTTFTGITGLAAADDGTKVFSIYATFKTLVTDNDNLKFTVSSATADPLGSTFAADNAGGATTDDTGDNNKLVVTADRLAITTPVSVVINTDFAVDIEATDANGSIDADETSSVTLVAATGTGTLSSVTGLTQSLSSGFYSWTDTQYDVAEDFTIEAQSGTLTKATSGTITALSSANTDLIISEVADPAGTGNHNGRFVELYNAGTSTIDFSSQTWYLTIQVNGGTMTSDQLEGTITSGGTFVTSYSESGFSSAYGFDSDQNTGHNGSGDDGYLLYYNGDHTTGTLVDAFGVIDVDGTGEAWEYTDTKAVRLRSVTTPNTTWTSTEWDIPGSAYPDDMTPDAHNEDVTWAGGGTEADDWNEKGGNWSGTYGYIPDASFNVTIPFTTVGPVVYSEAACNDLSLSSGAALIVGPTVPITVYGDLTIATSKSRAAASLTVEGDDTGNGSVIVEGSVSGPAVVQRYFAKYNTGDDGWHLIASPMDDMTIASSDFDTDVYTTNDLFQWDEFANMWENYKVHHFSVFEKGRGYLAAFVSDGPQSFTGTFTNTDITKSGLTLGAGSGWHALGNPYPSAIEYNADWTLTTVAATFKVYDESAGSYLDVTTGGIIPSTNGFFVQATAGGASVTIPKSSRVHNSTNNYKNSPMNTHEETLVLTITNEENMYYDLTRVGFKFEATEAWDPAFDSHKLFGASTAPQLWTVTNNDIYSWNNLPYSGEEYQVSLHFNAGVNSTYHINADGLSSFVEGTDIYLEDLFDEKIIDLNEQSLYTFTGSTDDNEARFVLHFNGVTSTGETPVVDNSKIYAYGNMVYISFNELPTDNFNVEVINMVGQVVYADEFAPVGLNNFSLDEKPGIYFIRLRAENKTVVQKVMISK